MTTLTPRQKSALLISGGAAVLSGSMLLGRATVKPAVQAVTSGGDASGAAILKSVCLATDLTFGASVTWDKAASIYVVSDGHECQRLAAGIVLDKDPKGVLRVSDHLATRVCNHLAQIGCAQPPAACAASVHAQGWTDQSQMAACLLSAKTFSAAAVCTPALTCGGSAANAH